MGRERGGSIYGDSETRRNEIAWQKAQPASVSAAMQPAGPTGPTAAEQYQAELDKQKKARDEATAAYRGGIQQAQVNPQTLQNNWQTYSQSKTAADTAYGDLTQKNIDANIKSNKDLVDQYNAKISPQFGLIQGQQAALDTAAQNARQQYANNISDATAYFNNTTSANFTNAMQKASKDYQGLKDEVQKKMDATDAYYQNNLKPAYARMMEGGLSLRDASDPSNYVSQGVQNAYQGLIDKSQADATTLQNQIKSGGQADYGVLAALGAQALGNQAGPTTGAQTQLRTQASQNQASQAYQQAMQRVGAIQDQQRLYAQQTRGTGLQAGMQASQQNYQNYMNATGAAQQADLNNYNAMLAGTSQLGAFTGADTSAQFQGAQGLAAARQGLEGTINAATGGQMSAASQAASGIGNLAQAYGNLASNQYGINQGLQEDILNKQQIVPGFNYQNQIGTLQGNYGVQNQMADLQSRNDTTLANIDYAGRAENNAIAQQNYQNERNRQLQQEAIDKQVAAAQAAQEAQNSGSIWSSVLGTVGTVGGAALGSFISPGVGTAIGAGIGGSLGGSLGNSIGGNGQGRTYVPPTINWGQTQSPSVGVSPMMQQIGNGGIGLGVDQSLYNAPYSRYNYGGVY